MSKALAVRTATPIIFTPDQVELIKRQIAKGATDDELAMFMHQCERTGLDPLAKQIYFRKQRSKNGDVVTIITGIDGYRLTADRTGLYAGNDDPVFDVEENPRKATVTVYKMIAGVRCGFTASARWDQYYPGDSQGFMWRKMPHLMLGKCAEALALRKAFPAELSGLYVKEEMDQAGADVVDVEHRVDPALPAADVLDGVFGEPIPVPSPKPKGPPKFDGSPKMAAALRKILEKDGIPPEFWEEIGDKLLGSPFAVQTVDEIIAKVKAGA